MEPDRLTNALAFYHSGEATVQEASAALMSAATAMAADGDAAAVYTRLPHAVQEEFQRDWASFSGVRSEFFILESYCGTDPDGHLEEKMRREDVAYKGTVALLRIVRGTPGSA